MTVTLTLLLALLLARMVACLLVDVVGVTIEYSFDELANRRLEGSLGGGANASIGS